MDRVGNNLAALAFFLCYCLHILAQKGVPQTGWGQWSNWSTCSKTCGSGLQTRVRVYVFPPGDPRRSSPDKFTSTDTLSCFARSECPVNGSWSEWGIWGECTAACGGGIRGRKRDCNAPQPAHGGKDCKGEGKETEPCKEEPCPSTPALFNMSQCHNRTTFTCRNRLMCVPRRQRCDGEVHCSDGSDELSCPRSHYKIGRVHFSNASPTHSASSTLAVVAVLVSSWFLKMFIGGHRHTADQSAFRP